MKILAIKFKYLGDIALWTSSLKSIKATYPNAELHCLVLKPSHLILQNIPWIHKIYSISKKDFINTLKTLRKLRNQQFDLSIDFVGNDRGALTSYFINADTRLGPISTKGFLGREYCYTIRTPEAPDTIHELQRELHLLSKINIPPAPNLSPELHPDPYLLNYAKSITQNNTIYCHIGSSAASKEWPVTQWAELWKQNPNLQQNLLFASGPSPREVNLLNSLKSLIPQAHFLNPSPSIPQLIAILSQSTATICGDTFTSHLSAALQTPTVTLYGPTNPKCWTPINYCIPVEAPNCYCRHFYYKCTHKTHCLSQVQPSEVISALNQALTTYGNKVAA